MASLLSMLQILRRLRAMSGRERQALVRGSLLIAFLRIGLLLLPFRVLLRAAQRMAPVARTRSARFDKDLAVWAVSSAARRFLRKNPCLTQALATLVLFRRAGVPAELHLGVARPDGQDLTAHAWVEISVVAVTLKKESVLEYTPLTTPDAGDV